MKDKGVSTTGAVLVIILLAIVGFFGYNFYQGREAMYNIESEVTGAGIPDPGLTSVDIPIEIEFHNESNYDSPSFTASYDIYIGDEKIGEGNLPSIVVPAGRTETATQEITINYEDVGAGLVDVLQTGEFTVTVEGDFKTKVAFGLIPISRSFKSTYSF